MEKVLLTPASFPFWLLSLVILISGVGIFTFIILKRLVPMIRAAPDRRFDRVFERTAKVVKLWLVQYKQPRYMKAGVLHILIFAGFAILSVRSFSLVCIGLSDGFVFPGLGGNAGIVYNIIKDYAATWVLVACVLAIIRRGFYKPARYEVPEKYGRDHTPEAIFVLCLISVLMLSESLFEASAAIAGLHADHIAPLSLAWFFKAMFSGVSKDTLQFLHIVSYYVHDLTFFFFLCFLPLGKHFHVITSIFNVYFMKLDKGSVKPVRWGVDEAGLDELESFGVKKFEDFTWKHILDFHSCADCGRCSDQCPANAAGRPLSPRFVSIKSRDCSYKSYPIRGNFLKSEPLVGNIFEPDEIWSCTTCGACEEECPLAIEYIDKIVDLRRGMVDEGMVPQSLQKPLSALQKRGNPYAKMEKKRADWTKALGKEGGPEVKIIGKKKATAETLYFVDSVTSYDGRIQEIAKASARVLTAAGVDFGILGPAEKDSGHEVRRFGEEMLFMDLKDKNTKAILDSGVKSITTADPHALNALKNDYDGLPPAEHISQTVLKAVQKGKLRLKSAEGDVVHVYHDPCYLGRHNELYEEPRMLIDSVPGINRIEMEKNRDRSFCCGGGGLMLFYEPIEEKRMGRIRVEMAHEAGATVIVTACPFCMLNIEDAIKTSGLEGKMEAVDLMELIDRHLAP